MLENYRTAILKRQEAEDDLNVQVKGQMAPEIKAKRREWKETEDELKKVEARLGEWAQLLHVSHGTCCYRPRLGLVSGPSCARFTWYLLLSVEARLGEWAQLLHVSHGTCCYRSQHITHHLLTEDNIHTNELLSRINFNW